MFCNFSVKYFEIISMVCTLFPADSIASPIYGIGVLSDRTSLLAIDPVLWSLLRPFMEYLKYLSNTLFSLKYFVLQHLFDSYLNILWICTLAVQTLEPEK